MMLLDSLKNILASAVAGPGKVRGSAQVASGDFAALMDQAVDQPGDPVTTMGNAVEGKFDDAQQMLSTDFIAQSDAIPVPSLEGANVGRAAPGYDSFEPIATQTPTGAAGMATPSAEIQLVPNAVYMNGASGLPIRVEAPARPASTATALDRELQPDVATSDSGEEAPSATRVTGDDVCIPTLSAPAPSTPVIGPESSSQSVAVASKVPIAADTSSSSVAPYLPAERPAVDVAQGRTHPHVQGEPISAVRPLSSAAPISPDAPIPSNAPAARDARGAATTLPVPQNGAVFAPAPAPTSPKPMVSAGDAPMQPATPPPAQAAGTAPVVDPRGSITVSVSAKSQSVPSSFEALSLLQWARDLTPERSGAKSESLVRAADMGDSTSVAEQVSLPTNLVVPAPPTVSAPTMPMPQPIAPTVDVAATIGATITDMSVGGQWIDRLARDIAGLVANGPKGSFQVAAGTLGPVEIAISRNSEGAVVSLRVASDAAEAALRQDGDRLRQDAALSAVRIADLRIERAPLADAPRGDAMGRDGGQHQGQPDQQGAMGRGAGQSTGQHRHDNNGFTPKGDADRAVLDDGQARDRTGDAPRARYA